MERKRGSIALVILVFVVVVGTILGGYSFFHTTKNTNNASITPQSTAPKLKESTPSSEISKEKTVTKNIENNIRPIPWSGTYFDSNTGLSFSYPSFVKLYVSTSSSELINGAYLPKDDLNLSVSLIKVASLSSDYPIYTSHPEIAKEEMDSLSKGEAGKSTDWEIKGSVKIIKIGNINAKVYMVLGRFMTCDVVFERTLRFYKNGYQIQMTLLGPHDQIVESMPEYFDIPLSKDSIPCWKTNSNILAHDGFYQAITNNKGSEAAKRWFDTFDQIVNSIKIS